MKIQQTSEVKLKTLTPSGYRGIGVSHSLFLLLKKATASLALAGFILFLGGIAYAETWSDTQIANAIYKAENSKSHPYGILKKYKHTTPRQACINTIRHARRDWDGKGDFIVFLGSRYCPPTAHYLNVNWVKNVKYFLEVQNG